MVIGETNDEYLESIDYLYDLIDVALHHKISSDSQEGENFDLNYFRRNTQSS